VSFELHPDTAKINNSPNIQTKGYSRTPCFESPGCVCVCVCACDEVVSTRLRASSPARS